MSTESPDQTTNWLQRNIRACGKMLPRNWLGPGFITGAADDDPSGIATYSMAGATAGLSLLWAALLTLPMLVVVQEMCARIAVVTRRGLTPALLSELPRWCVQVIIYLVVFANTVNIAADMNGISAAVQLIFPINTQVVLILFTALFIATEILFSYVILNRIAKLFAITLLAYIGTVCIIHPSPTVILRHFFIPEIHRDPSWLLLLAGFLGTTITPYLFFWQAAQEVEELESQPERSVEEHLRTVTGDTWSGMIFSNIIAACIVIATAVTLYNHHVNIVSAADAARALAPIAGKFASLIFAIGIVGVGILSVPVLANSSAFALSELHDWRHGLSEPFARAKPFYVIIIVGLLSGLATSFTHIDVFAMLLGAAVINGVVAVPLLIAVTAVANRSRCLGKHVNNPLQNIVAIFTIIVMTASSLAAIVGLLPDNLKHQIFHI